MACGELDCAGLSLLSLCNQHALGRESCFLIPGPLQAMHLPCPVMPDTFVVPSLATKDLYTQLDFCCALRPVADNTTSHPWAFRQGRTRNKDATNGAPGQTTSNKVHFY